MIAVFLGFVFVISFDCLLWLWFGYLVFWNLWDDCLG